MNSCSDYDQKVACRLGKALHHFASVLCIPQAEYLQQFLKENNHLANGSEDEIKVLIFGSMEKFENWWCQIVDQFTEDRKRLQSFHDMDDHLMKMDNLCNKMLGTFEDYMLIPISARSAIKTIIRGLFPTILTPLQWRALDYFEFYLDQTNQDMYYDMYEYTRLLEPRYPLGPEFDLGDIDCEKLQSRLEELETRALHPREKTTSQRQQERYETIIGDLGPEEQTSAQARYERKKLPSRQSISDRDSQSPESYNDKNSPDADSDTSDNPGTNAFHFDDATLSDEEPLLRKEDHGGEVDMPTSGGPAFTRNMINNYSGPAEPQTHALGTCSDASDRSPLLSRGRLSPCPPSYHSTSDNFTGQSLILVDRFEQDPFFAITTKYINPTQYFLLRRENCEVPFRVVRGGIKGDIWSFVVNLTYTKEQMRQLLESCRPTDNQTAEDLVQMLLRSSGSIHKRVIATKKGDIHYKVVDVYIEDEWKFGLERKVTFDELKSMLRQSLRMEKGAETLWI